MITLQDRKSFVFDLIIMDRNALVCGFHKRVRTQKCESILQNFSQEKLLFNEFPKIDFL